MRKLTILFLLIIGHLGFSQNVRTLDPKQIESVPGEILIKLEDDVEPNINIQNGIIQSYDSSTVLDKLGLRGKVFSSKILFSIKTRKYKTPRYQTGTVRKDKYNLNNLMKVKLKEEFFNEKDQLIEDLNQRKEVEYAEPNYIFSIEDYKIESNIISEEEALNYKEENYSETEDAIKPNDPLFNNQNNITRLKIDKAWKDTRGDTTSVIAILDTGVDTEHPDLKDNIWINHNERLGVSEYDDDENGFKDDINGWDFINDDNEPKDDNMHGTHVAGIAAAVSDNEKGIAGTSWNSKIMPIKVFQSSGRGNSVTIAQGIEYAYQNGATILNMSFGSYSKSITMQLALENAYAYATLVASAGNDKLCIGPGKCPSFPPKQGRPKYPAGYSYVLGVQSRNGGFSNYDQDGPINSKYSELYNYEVFAPGNKIISTVPNGGYRELSGTSMSAPLVSGIIALYNDFRSDDSKELLFANIINTPKIHNNNWIDVDSILHIIPKPELKVISGFIIDTLLNSENGINNNNTILEAGETVFIRPTIKNYWGPTDSVYVSIEWKEFEDTSKAEIIDSLFYYGMMSPYSNLFDNSKLFRIKISDELKTNVDIVFKIKTWSGDEKKSLDSMEYILSVQNKNYFSGYYKDTTLILDGNKTYEYIPPIIFENVKIILKPGTTLLFSHKNYRNTKLKSNVFYEAIGKKDSIISIIGIDNYANPFYVRSIDSTSIFQHVYFENIMRDPGQHEDRGDSGSKNEIYNSTFVNSLFSYSTTYNSLIYSSDWNDLFGSYVRGWKIRDSNIQAWNYFNSNNNNVIVGPFYFRGLANSNNYIGQNKTANNNLLIYNHSAMTGRSLSVPSSLLGIVPIGENQLLGIDINENGKIDEDEPESLYHGINSKSLFKKIFLDFFDNVNGAGWWDWENSKLRLKPFSEAPGIVWKILVNGKDAQDEYDDMDPIGVGRHKFEVYFNKPMDTLYTPQVSMGVRIPYNQIIFDKSQGSWSSDSTIYTIFHTVDARTADGINRLRVSGAKDTKGMIILTENIRFSVLVQAAGSLSSEFQATPGLGKISLDWKGEELTDHLGYNMYRYKAITDSTYSPTKQINTSLITDSTYIDYDVDPGKQYFYKYTTLRTNFTETDTSKTVSTTPLTADLGDANGDFEVDILDVIHQINYILGSSPQPFIMDAADVNNDGAVNVLDVVGTVNLILNPVGGNFYNPGEINYISQEPLGEAELFWRGDTLFVDSPIPLAGLQLSFDYDLDYRLLDAVDGFESMGYDQDDEKVLMLYSLSGKKLTSGVTPILTKAEPGEVHVTKAVFSNIEGRSVTANYMGYVLEEIAAKKQSSTIFSVGYPNPTSGRYILEYHIPEQVDGVGLVVYDLNGKVIHADGGLKNTSGRHRVEIDLSTKQDGIYIAVLSIGNKGYLLKQDVKRIVKE